MNDQNYYKRYSGKWIVIDKNNSDVISVGTTSGQVLSDAEKQGYSGLSATKVPRILDESEYIGEYLAINPETGEIIAHDKDLLKVSKISKSKGINNPIFRPVQELGVHQVEVTR